MQQGAKMSKDPITVYWAPAINNDNTHPDFGLLYSSPKQLFSNLRERKAEKTDSASIFSCPAFSELTKSTVVFNSPMSCSYEFDSTDTSNPTIKATTKNLIGARYVRPPYLQDGPILHFQLYYIFFATEPVEALFTSPYFHKPQHTKYGSVTPGKFDIGQWFRPYNFEVQMWNMKGEFHLKEQEPMFYVEFKTDRPIILKQFNNTQELLRISDACVATTDMFGRGQTLLSRYFRFRDTGMKQRTLKLIENNIIEGSELRLGKE
jgi:hypothetical protein